jgi:hypothetical protein
MNVTAEFPPARIPTQALDGNDLADVQRRLLDLAEQIRAIAPQVADARQVREYDSDRRKRVLSLAMQSFLQAGDSHAKADALARATDGYGSALDTLAAQLADAEHVIALDSALRIQWESMRSIQSMMKANL